MKPYHFLDPGLFWEKADTSSGQGPEGDCWLWTGHKTASGAGQITTSRDKQTFNFKAHRVAHWLHYGHMPDDLFCVHACGEPGCVNPRHLYLSDRKKGIAEARIMRLFDKSPGFGPNGECWRFTGHITKGGYGSFSDNRSRSGPAHRFVFEMIHGALPTDIHVCHHCDNRACVNPAHLFAGSHADNMADRNAKGRQSRARKHAKITEDDARAIKVSPGSHDTIAARFGISRTTVSFIKSGRRWGHLS